VIVMRRQETTEKIKNWTRVAAWLGVLLTEPKVRAKVGQSLKDRAESFADKASSKYDEAVHRMESARDALRGKTSRGPQVAGFLAGLGIGAGLGLLLAPSPGSETRSVVRAKAAAAGSKIASSATMVARSFAQSGSHVPRTGTEA
jgi:hypothetical protein